MVDASFLDQSQSIMSKISVDNCFKGAESAASTHGWDVNPSQTTFSTFSNWSSSPVLYSGGTSYYRITQHNNH